MLKWAIAVLGTFAAIGILYVAMIAFFWLGPSVTVSCTQYPVMSVPSPSGGFRAEVKNEVCTSKGRRKTIVWLTDGVPVNVGGKTWTALIAPYTQE